MKYEQILQALYQRNEFSIKLGLENTKTLLNHLGQPLKKYPTIHIAGTNGKGSVANFLASILRKEGFKVGLYTSPHLIDFRERIQINQKMISKKAVLDGLQKIDRLIQRQQKKDPTYSPTYFEVVTALALKHFEQQKVDMAILETGLGGRLDSTNVCHPLVSVITNIGFDHLSILGSNLASIAREKAGIIKVGVPVVTGETRRNRFYLLEKVAKKKKAPLILTPKISRHHQQTEKVQERFDYQSDTWKLLNLTIPMGGGASDSKCFNSNYNTRTTSSNRVSSFSLFDSQGLGIKPMVGTVSSPQEKAFVDCGWGTQRRRNHLFCSNIER